VENCNANSSGFNHTSQSGNRCYGLGMGVAQHRAGRANHESGEYKCPIPVRTVGKGKQECGNRNEDLASNDHPLRVDDSRQ
jgi:hypothetical protein